MNTLTPPTGTPTDAPRVRRAWKQTEIERAVRLIAAGHSIDETAIRLGRTEDGIRWLFSRTLGIRPEKIRVAELVVEQPKIAEWNVSLFGNDDQ